MNKTILFVLVLTVLTIHYAHCITTDYHNIISYDSVLTIEKVYLHTDRHSYYPGDDLWFKAYLVDASDLLLSDNSVNLHVELISPDLKIIESHIVKLNGGLGNGDFHLSDNLESGRYRLRAYTNYMRNFADIQFFNKDVIIINSSDAGKIFPDSITTITDKPEIIFFPEGGSLVSNVSSVVAFKAVNSKGSGLDLEGVIYSSDNELVTTFKSSHKGMGTFILDPVPGISYYALIKNSKGDLFRYDIPRSFPAGVVMNISKNAEGELLITFKTNDETYARLKDRDLILNVSARNVQLKNFSFRMKSINSFFYLSTMDLPEGIVMLTLTGVENTPLCERLVYVQNNEDVKINLETGKEEYKQRDSVSVKLSLPGTLTSVTDAFLSLSVTDNLFTDNSSGFPSSISSWFLLESDVRGPVEDPSYYFDPTNPDRLKDLDLLLMTQGWRDFAWKYNKIKYPPEYGFSISGRVRKKLANKPLKNSGVTIGIFKVGKPLLYSLPVDSAGRFQLERLDFTGEAKLIASITEENSNLKGWLLLDSVKYSPAIVKESFISDRSVQDNGQFRSGNELLTENKTIGKNMHTFIKYAEIKNSIKKKYKLSDTITPGEVIITAERKDWTETPRLRARHYLMGTPDHEVVITPEDKRYITAYGLISERFITPLKQFPSYLYSHWIQHPLYLIDGNRVTENDVKSLPISYIDRIDVVDNPASFLALRTLVEIEIIDSTGVPVTVMGYADGAISIILKDINDPIFDKSVLHSVNVRFPGFNEPRIFYSPKHHSTLESDYKPDLRTTLFWEPDIKMENNKSITLNFYNADNQGRIMVTVEGISSNGIPITGKTEYNIR